MGENPTRKFFLTFSGWLESKEFILTHCLWKIIIDHPLVCLIKKEKTFILGMKK